MTALVIALRIDELCLLNGAMLQPDRNVRLRLLQPARVLHGAMVLEPREANTPLRQLYLALQHAYFANDATQAAALSRAVPLLERAADATPFALALPLHEALRHARAGRAYATLKALNPVIRSDTAK